jgi:hypothetical protein
LIVARRLGISALVLMGALLLPVAASARQSAIYSGFDRCPTADPAMNDPANFFAACVSTSAGGGLLKVGSLEESIQSPLNLQAAVVGGPSGPALVPGSISVEGLSFQVPLGGAGANLPTFTPPSAAKPAATPAHRRKRHRRKRRRHRHHRHHGHRHAHHRHRSLDQQGYSIEVSVEPAGEPTFELAGSPSDPLALIQLLSSGQIPITLRVPLKIHIGGPQLGPDCYIGSDAAPIVAAPQIVSPPLGFSVARDPNGYLTLVAQISDFDIEDGTFAIPGAEGCGQNGALDQTVDEIAGLPAPAGSSRLLLSDVSASVAVAGYLSSPGGGAELQAAFDAAR